MDFEKVVQFRNLTTTKEWDKYYSGRFTVDNPYMNRTIAFDNLLDFTQILDKCNIDYYLMFGTLLGFFRDNQLIKHDQDIDIAIKSIHKEKLYEKFDKLEQSGFKIKRIIWDTDLITFVRSEEYIDVYVLNEVNGDGSSYRLANTKFQYDSIFFNIENHLNIKGKEFKIPYQPEKLLKKMYGNTWKIPVSGISAHQSLIIAKLKKAYSKLPNPIKKIYRKLRKPFKR